MRHAPSKIISSHYAAAALEKRIFHAPENPFFFVMNFSSEQAYPINFGSHCTITISTQPSYIDFVQNDENLRELLCTYVLHPKLV